MPATMPSQPDTMKLHPPTVSHKAHFEKVAAALKAETTVVFCDTSVLFWLFGLSAKRELSS